MLYRDYEANEWKLMPLVATFLQHEKEHEQYVIDKTELRAHEEMAHVDELKFKEAEYDQGILTRLEEVKEYPQNEFQTVTEYVLNNNILPGTSLALKKQNELLEASVIELATTIAMTGGF